MKAGPECPICASARSVRFLLARNGWRLHRCRDCDHIFVSPLPTQAELAHLYSFAAGYQLDPGAECAMQGPRHPKFVERIEQLRRHCRSGRLLDVGASRGDFLQLARERGFEVQGVERNPDTAAVARSAGLPIASGTLEEAAFAAASFDAVHLGDVIEHVSEVSPFLAEVRRVLRPGGWLIASTPNHAAFFAKATFALYRALRIPWSHATPPFHLHQFSTRSLSRLLEGHGFRAVEVCYARAELAYEVRATGIPGRLKRALAARDVAGVLRHGPATAATALGYGLVWLADGVRVAGAGPILHVVARLGGPAS